MAVQQFWTAIVVLGSRPLFVGKLYAACERLNRCNVGDCLRAILDSRNEEYNVAVSLVPRRGEFDYEEVVGNVALVERAKWVAVEVATRSL